MTVGLGEGVRVGVGVGDGDEELGVGVAEEVRGVAECVTGLLLCPWAGPSRFGSFK